MSDFALKDAPMNTTTQTRAKRVYATDLAARGLRCCFLVH